MVCVLKNGPVDAISVDDNVPDEFSNFIELNKEYSEKFKGISYVPKADGDCIKICKRFIINN